MVERDRQRPYDSRRDEPGKVCPWCNGRLLFEPQYPTTWLIPGKVRTFQEEERVPERLRTVPAWVCATPDCRFRAHAGIALR